MLFKATVTLDHKLSINNKVAFSAYLPTLEVGTIIDVTIAKEKKKRSLSQNNALWMMAETLDKLYMGYNDKDRAKWILLIAVGHFDEFEINGLPTRLPRTTKGLSKVEFSELLEKCIIFGVTEYSHDLTPIITGSY
jgi:hypothetical protein